MCIAKKLLYKFNLNILEILNQFDGLIHNSLTEADKILMD